MSKFNHVKSVQHFSWCCVKFYNNKCSITKHILYRNFTVHKNFCEFYMIAENIFYIPDFSPFL